MANGVRGPSAEDPEMSTTAPLKITGTRRDLRRYCDEGSHLLCRRPDGVNSGHGIHEAVARGRSARGNHVQRAVLDASTRASWGAIPDGRRRDRNRFDRADRVSGCYSRAGTRVGISGSAGSAKGGEARSKREDLFGAVPLRTAAGQARREAKDLVNRNALWTDEKRSGNVNGRTLENHKGCGTRQAIRRNSTAGSDCPARLRPHNWALRIDLWCQTSQK
jgi:hypothetical protein